MYHNMCRKETTFGAFKSQITSNVCRSHSDCINIFDTDTGILLSSQFVHVQRYVQLHEVISLRYSYKAYKTAIAQSSLEPDTNYSCSHCLYLINHIEPQLTVFPDILQAEAAGTDTCIQQMIKNSTRSIDMEMFYLPPITKGSNKTYFSVLCPHSYTLCHSSGDFVLCGKTSFKENNLNKRKDATHEG